MAIDRMLAWIEPLITPGFEAPPYAPAYAATTLKAAEWSAEHQERFLTRWNGCYALDGALHLFGARPDPPNQSLDAWNRPDGWRQSFGAMLDGVQFFAENAFGDQFGYRNKKVVRLRVFEGRLEPIASDFAEWLSLVAVEPARFLATDLFAQCVGRLGPLPFGGHFAPPPTWIPNTALRVDQMTLLPSRDNMEFRGAASMMSVSLGARNAARR
jgi:hypothetical protein